MRLGRVRWSVAYLNDEGLWVLIYEGAEWR